MVSPAPTHLSENPCAGQGPQSFSETWVGQITPCHGLGARMLTVNMKLLSILEHAAKTCTHASQMVPCSSVLISQTYRFGCGLSPPPQSSRTELGRHHRSAAQSVLELGRDYTLLPSRLAPFITPADRLDLCAGEKGKATKTPPHTKRSAARMKDSYITFFCCCIQGLFGPNSLPDLIYHDYTPSPISKLISSRELNS